MVMMMLHKIQVSARERLFKEYQGRKSGFFHEGYPSSALEIASAALGIVSARTNYLQRVDGLTEAEKNAIQLPPAVKLMEEPIDDPLFYTVGALIRKHTLNINERIQKELNTKKVIRVNPISFYLNGDSRNSIPRNGFCLSVTAGLVSKRGSMNSNEGFRDLTSELSDYALAITECIAGLRGNGNVIVSKSKSILLGIPGSAPEDWSGILLEIWFDVATSIDDINIYISESQE